METNNMSVAVLCPICRLPAYEVCCTERSNQDDVLDRNEGQGQGPEEVGMTSDPLAQPDPNAKVIMDMDATIDTDQESQPDQVQTERAKWVMKKISECDYRKEHAEQELEDIKARIEELDIQKARIQKELAAEQQAHPSDFKAQRSKMARVEGLKKENSYVKFQRAREERELKYAKERMKQCERYQAWMQKELVREMQRPPVRVWF